MHHNSDTFFLHLTHKSIIIINYQIITYDLFFTIIEYFHGPKVLNTNFDRPEQTQRPKLRAETPFQSVSIVGRYHRQGIPLYYNEIIIFSETIFQPRASIIQRFIGMKS